MKTMKTLALASATLLLAGSALGQATTTSTTNTNNTNNTSLSPTGRMSVRDNPGVLGHSFTELNYSWIDFDRREGVRPDGFTVGVNGNAPVAQGLDLGFGYNYYRENGHRNPFTGTSFDPRFHELGAKATIYAPVKGFKPFFSGGVGYQWSRGDIQRLRAYDDMWVWTGGVGAELPLGGFTLTPRVTYTDAFDDNAIGSWHYSGELHRWFNDKVGGFLNVTFHEPRRSSLRPDSWSYMAGLRMRY